MAWVTPQLMEAWDDENVDVDRLLNRIINGVLHHPAQRHMGEDGAQEGRDLMFRSVEEWWNEMDEGAKDEYRQKLSRDGVMRNENHREGVHDTGHGCGKPIGMHKNFQGGGTIEDRIAGAAAGAIFEGITGGLSSVVESQTGGQVKLPSGGGGGGEEFSGGGLLSQLGSSLLGGAFKNEEKESYESRGREDDGSYTESRTEYGRSGDRYGQANYSETQYSGGGERTEYSRYEQDDGGRGYNYQEQTETRTSYGGGGYEERTERRYESTEERQESSGWNQRRGDDDSYGGRGEDYGRREERSEYDRSDNYNRQERQEYGRSDEYERSDNDGRGERQEYGRSDNYNREEGREESESDNRRRRRDDEGGW